MSANLRVTRLTNRNGTLTKRFALNADGTLDKTTAASLYEGDAEVIECTDLSEFMTVRSRLGVREALTYGIPARTPVRITTQAKLREHPSAKDYAIARDAASFDYPRGPGILMLDHDAEHVADIYDRDSLRAALLSAVPELIGAPMAWATSASSYILNAETGNVLQGLKGQRLYLALTDATDIPRVGRIIYERLWAAGIGTFIVSKAGALLDRNIIDASAWQAERIDFAAGAECVPPLMQDAPCWHLWEATGGGIAPWDSCDHLTELTAQQKESASEYRAAARARVAAKARETRNEYIETRAQVLVDTQRIEIDEARRLARDAVSQRLLFAEWVLHPEAGGTVTVAEVLDDPNRWHGTRFADPVEPTYRGDRRIAWANLRSGGRPYLFSHAHGLAQRYELVRQPAQLMIQAGEQARLTDECVRIIREHGDLFDFGTHEIARIADGRLYTVTPDYMLDYLHRNIRFTRFDRRARAGDEVQPANCPKSVATALVERTGERLLPKLRGIVTAPTLRSDGTVLDKPGFDAVSGLLYACDDPSPPHVPLCPTDSEVNGALHDLLAPVAQFPFASREARGVALAAMLTACVRRSLPTAPGFAFDAPAPGTGKSLLARTILALGGHSTESHKPPKDDEECGKVLFAALRVGTGALLFDNWATPIGGPAIDHFLTAEEYAGRILQTSVNAGNLPNGALMLFTGNNIELMGDTCRRVLTCRLDARAEHPHRRAFGFDPVQFVKARRGPLVRAALTLIRGYLSSGVPRRGRPLGSFEAWDALVRQTVCWLADKHPQFGLDDPNITSEAAEGSDDSKGHLEEILRAWFGVFGFEPVSAQAALDAAFTFGDGQFSGGADPKRDAMAQALDLLKRHPRDSVTAVRLGKYLKTQKHRIAGNLRFEGTKARNGSMQWFVRAVDAAGAGSQELDSRKDAFDETTSFVQEDETTPAFPAPPALTVPADIADLV